MIPLLEYDDLYRHGLPDQKSILQAAIQVVTRNGDHSLLPTLSMALARVDVALEQERSWQVARTPTVERQRSMEIDLEIQGLVRDLYRCLSAVAEGRLHPQRPAAAELVRACFPRGLGAHVLEDFTDKVERTEELVRVLRRPGHEGVVRALSLTPTVDALAELNEAFRAGLVVDRSVTREAVSRAAARAMRATRCALHLVLGSFDPDDEVACGRRDEALAQLRAVEVKIRQRRAVGPRKKVRGGAAVGGEHPIEAPIDHSVEKNRGEVKAASPDPVLQPSTG